MKIGIVGAGGLGSIFGGGLVGAGHDVWFVDVDPLLVDVLHSNGLTIVHEGEDRVYPVNATTESPTVGVCDLVIVLVKAYHTQSAASLARPLVGPDTVIASLQNGLGSCDVLAEMFPPEQIVQGVTYHGATVIAKGIVLHNSIAATYVGPYTGSDLAGAELLASAWRSAGWETYVTPDAGQQVWNKIVLNSGNAVAALTRLPSKAMVEQDDVFSLLNGLIRESAAVAHTLGYTSIDPDAAITTMVKVLTQNPDGRASMLQDVLAGRRTEVEVLNGAIARVGAEHGVSTPINSALYSLIVGFEHHSALEGNKSRDRVPTRAGA